MRIILICISIMVGCSGLGACSTVLTEDELFARDWKRGIGSPEELRRIMLSVDNGDLQMGLHGDLVEASDVG